MKFYIFFTFYCAFLTVSGLELPAYISKCSLKDPNLNQCIKDNGNAALPEVVKGIPSFRIPVLAPLHLPTYQLDEKDVKLQLKDLDLHGLEGFRLASVAFNLQEKTALYIITVPYLNATSDYVAVDDKTSKSFNFGSGKLSISLVGNEFKANGNLSVNVIDEKPYMQLDSLNMNLKTQHTDYKFDEVSNGGDDSLSEHSKILERQLQTGMLKIVTKIFRDVVVNVLGKVPFNEIFNE